MKMQYQSCLNGHLFKKVTDKRKRCTVLEQKTDIPADYTNSKFVRCTVLDTVLCSMPVLPSNS